MAYKGNVLQETAYFRQKAVKRQAVVNMTGFNEFRSKMRSLKTLDLCYIRLILKSQILGNERSTFVFTQ
jgi:hypothetical protein